MNSTTAGFNAGGGIAGFISDRFGYRGDVRYFRSLQENDLGDADFAVQALQFWRVSGGVIIRF